MLGYLEGLPELKGDNITMKIRRLLNPHIGSNVVLKNAKIGPHVSLGDGCVVENATIKGSLIQTNSSISNIDLKDSMVGNHASVNGKWTSISIGDYSTMEE